MTDLENKIWDMVNKWCEMQYHDVPEANKRYLMDMIHGLVENCKKQNVTDLSPAPKYCSQCGEPLTRKHKMWCLLFKK